MLWLLRFPEFYALAVPYLLLGGWQYRKLFRRQYRSTGHLLGVRVVFWLVFLVGLAVVAAAALLAIMVRHAEHV